MKLWHAIYLHPRKMGKKLFGAKKGATSWARAISGLASNKATAISCRLDGEIRSASIYETIVDQIYDRSPVAVRDMWEEIENSSAHDILALLK